MGLKKKFIRLAKGNFKKAWRLQKKSSKKKKPQVSKLKHANKKKSTRRVARKQVKSMGKNPDAFSVLARKAVAGFSYGIVREPINEVVKTLTAKLGIPALQTSDEIALLITSGILSRNLSGLPKRIADAGFLIESHNLGRNINLGSILPGATAAPAAQVGAAENVWIG